RSAASFSQPGRSGPSPITASLIVDRRRNEAPAMARMRTSTPLSIVIRPRNTTVGGSSRGAGRPGASSCVGNNGLTCTRTVSMPVLSAEARAQVSVHELDHRPMGRELAVHLQSIHVVREAHVRVPALYRGKSRIDAVGFDAELRQAIRRRRSKRLRLHIAVQN